eukprot:766000-Hanusia_phi.AAC.10
MRSPHLSGKLEHSRNAGSLAILGEVTDKLQTLATLQQQDLPRKQQGQEVTRSSLSASPSKPHLTTDIFGNALSAWVKPEEASPRALCAYARSLGVFSSTMLNPLKIICSTTMGGNIASATSEEGEIAPNIKPTAELEREWTTFMSMKARNLLRFLWKPTIG